MGKLTLFEITLTNPQGIYYPGQTLEGHVTVELNEEMEMRGIRLLFYGGAHVRWRERRSSGKSHYYVTYSSYETYFSQELVLFGKASGAKGDNPTLAAGRYTYPFHYQIPPGMPSSFEGSFGRVRYWLNGTIDKPWKFDHTTKRAFTVVNLLDLNTVQGAKDRLYNQSSKSLCCLCCKSGPISCVLQIDRCGYVPGESIAIRGEVTNDSNRKMKRSYAGLYMNTVYHTPSKSRTETRTVVELNSGEILPGDSDTWNGHLIKIPPLPPSELPGCRIIVIDYFVKLCVDPAGPAFDLEVPVKVIIGSIPLQSTLQQYGVGPPALNPSSSQLYSVPSGSSNMPPPTYAESAFGVVDIKDDEDSDHVQGNRNFTPMYAYYNWGDPVTPSAPQK